MDARIKIFSIYLAQIVEDSPFDLTTCCHLATAKTNNSISKIGLSPAEVYVGRSWTNQEQIKVEVKELLKKVKERRDDRRKYEERKAAEKFLKNESGKIPYKCEELNSPLVNNPELIKIKAGDIVTLKETVNKNHPRCSYEVIKVDFPNLKVLLKRVSHRDTKDAVDQWISFKLIHSIHTPSDLQFINSLNTNDLFNFSQICHLSDTISDDSCHHSLSQINNIESGMTVNPMPILKVWNMPL